MQKHEPFSEMHLKKKNEQLGVTLIELMIGISIGLLVIAVAMGALMVSRGVSGTVSDASTIQQQGAYAMRLIGLQVRQAGSLRLNLNSATTKTADLYMAPVAFETAAISASNPSFSFDALNQPKQTVSGSDSPTNLTVGYRRYTEPVFTNTAEQALSKNCLGGPADSRDDQRLESIFSFKSSDNTLQCDGNGAGQQPVIQNVADFQVRYLMQDTTTTPGMPMIRTVDAATVNTDPMNWTRIQAIQVCIVLYGAEAINLPTDGTAIYTDCTGNSVDMAMLTGSRAKRMHIAFRNTFQLRSQGLINQAL